MIIRSVTAFTCFVCVLFLAGCSDNSYLESSDMPEDEIIESGMEPEGAADAVPEMIFVQVAGAVESPGVYELAPDSRVFEAIDMAGGLCDDADEYDLNQAGILEDGQKLYIFREGEAEALAQSEAVKAEDAGDNGNLVNINTADTDRLKSLSGIGDAKASAIIAYREAKGGFSSIDELKEVDGIGDATLNRLRDQITL